MDPSQEELLQCGVLHFGLHRLIRFLNIMLVIKMITQRNYDNSTIRNVFQTFFDLLFHTVLVRKVSLFRSSARKINVIFSVNAVVHFLWHSFVGKLLSPEIYMRL